MNASVSAILAESHGITAQPGAKVECPFCRHKTFSIKRDDLLGKCFHPACGRFRGSCSIGAKSVDPLQWTGFVNIPVTTFDEKPYPEDENISRGRKPFPRENCSIKRLKNRLISPTISVGEDPRFPPQLCPSTHRSTFPVRLLREPQREQKQSEALQIFPLPSET
jgi:hypothetical protein